MSPGLQNKKRLYASQGAGNPGALRLAKKPRRVFCLGEKIILIVFCGDMCVAENTSHGAKCRIVRLWRTTEAWSEVQSFFVEEGYVFFDKLRAPGFPAPFAVDKAARRAYNVQQDRKGRKARC